MNHSEYHDLPGKRIKIAVHFTPQRLGWTNYGYRATVAEVVTDLIPLAGGRTIKTERIVRKDGFCDTLHETEIESPGGEREALNVLSLRRQEYIGRFMQIFKQ